MTKRKSEEKPVVLIMAGGKGERFWPRSRESLPKQLQKVYSNKTLLEETISRALLLTDISRIFIGTNKNMKKAILKSLPKFPKNNFILEPEPKNTAPIVALASLFFQKKFGNPVQIVLSADAYIQPPEKFKSTMQSAVEAANSGSLVLLGVEPNRPETGYGYIAAGKKNGTAYEVKAFYEKPDLKTAMKYIRKKNFYWNPGIFIWKTESILSEFQRHAPYILHPLEESSSASELQSIFKKLPSEAIDVAIMEKSSSIVMVDAEFQWDDVGSWISLERVLKGDENGNFHIGRKSFHLKSRGNISSVKKGMVVFLGVEDLILVEEDDLIFVSSKKGIGEIKSLLSELRKNKDLQKYLV